MQKSKLAIVVLGLIAGGNAAAGDNKAYIGGGLVAGDSIKNLTVDQSQTGAGDGNNSIGTVGTDFSVTGGWETLSITQEYNAAAPLTPAGNTVTGSIKATSGSTTSSLTIVQTGTENAVALTLGGTNALVNPVINLTQTGSYNTSTYTLDNGGATTITETLTGGILDNANTVNVTSGTAVTAFASNITVNGNNNDIDTSRTGAGSYTDTITVNGNASIVDLTGTATGTNVVTLTLGTNTSSTGNQVYANQSGVSNSLILTLAGDSNIAGTSGARLAQSGSGSQATIALAGTGGNTITLAQAGTDAITDIDVTTSNSTFNITQNTTDAYYGLSGTVTDSSTITVTQ